VGNIKLIVKLKTHRAREHAGESEEMSAQCKPVKVHLKKKAVPLWHHQILVHQAKPQGKPEASLGNHMKP
jgi:hypothetical protein